MNIQILTESPSWLIILCVAAGLLCSWILYRRDLAFRETSLWVKRTMAVLRFLSVTFLAILLLSPLVRTIFQEIEKPIVILVQDQSESITGIRDSVAFRENYTKQLRELQSELGNDFDVRSFSAGAQVREGIDLNFNEKETDLSAPVNEIRARFAGRNMGAVILASDGIYNKGTNPLYAFPELKVPVYTIGLGDTSVRKDALISKVTHNKTAYFGNTFPVEITIDARQCSGSNLTFTISRNKNILFSKVINVTSDRMNMVVPVFLEANEKGMNHFTANISKVENEINYINNTREFFIDVTDSRQQILILANSPHPDIRMIKNILEQNPNYQVQSVLVDDYNGDITGVNLVILHQLPSISSKGGNFAEQLAQLKIPVFYILGSQSGIPAFNKLNTGLAVNDHRSATTEVMAEPVREFALFTMEDEYMRRISGFPPLVAPFGNYDAQSNIYPLLTQRVGTVKTSMPLLYFSTDGEHKSAVLTGEGIWKWQLREFAEYNNTEAVSALVTKTVQYLATREKKTPFRIYFKNSYDENEQVTMDAEFYNESGELVNTSDARINIVNENGENFPFTFSKSGKAYSLNGGYMPVGFYKFTANLISGGKTFAESGSFTVTALQAELTETIADHNLLKAISERTGGKFFESANAGVVAKEINSRNDIRPVSYTQNRLDDVINLKWIFALIIFLLSLEWMLRKRSGSY